MCSLGRRGTLSKTFGSAQKIVRVANSSSTHHIRTLEISHKAQSTQIVRHRTHTTCIGLYLNIYAPLSGVVSPGSTPLAPVMVYFPGTSQMAIHNHCVLVSFVANLAPLTLLLCPFLLLSLSLSLSLSRSRSRSLSLSLSLCVCACVRLCATVSVCLSVCVCARTCVCSSRL